MLRQILAPALAALVLAAPAQATDLTAMTDAERAAFRAEVRAYLLDNPEVLMEAIAVLEQRQAEAQLANDATLVQVNAEAIFDDGYSWVGGNPEGDITLVEFTDYRCTYCRKAFTDVEELIGTDGNIRFILKEFPILGEESLLASRYAIAVKDIEGDAAYKKAHDALMTFRGNISAQSLANLSDRLALDHDKIAKQMESDEVTAVIQANYALAQRMDISGTPTFVLGSQLLRGYAPLDAMREMVAQERAD